MDYDWQNFLIDAPIVAHVFLDLRVSEGLGPAVIGGNRAGMGRVKSQGSITVELATEISRDEWQLRCSFPLQPAARLFAMEKISRS